MRCWETAPADTKPQYSEWELFDSSRGTIKRNVRVGSCVDGGSNNPRKQLPGICDFLLVSVARRQMEASGLSVWGSEGKVSTHTSLILRGRGRKSRLGSSPTLVVLSPDFRRPNELSQTERSELPGVISSNACFLCSCSIESASHCRAASSLRKQKTNPIKLIERADENIAASSRSRCRCHMSSGWHFFPE